MADAPPPPKEVPGQSNRPNTTQPTSCDCLVCELDRLARHERQRLYRGSWTAFSASPGELNIVGVRRKDSFSDRFDDYLCAFFRPFTSAAEVAKLDAELGDDLKARAKAGAASARVVRCRQTSGVWVTLWWPASTDPGQSDTKSPERWRALDEKVRAEEAALGIEPGGAPPKDRPKEAVTVEGQGGLKTRAQAVKALVRDRKLREAIARNIVFLHGEAIAAGSYEHGKGFLPAGFYKSEFPLDFHHATKIFEWTDSYRYHPALHRMGTGGFRSFSGASLRLHQGVHEGEKIAGRPLLRRLPGGQLAGSSWLPPTGSEVCTIDREATGEKRWVVRHTQSGREEALAPDDVVFVAMEGVAGTNIHRGHQVRFDGGALAASSGDAVGAWSDGCQVAREFADFTLFLRLASAMAQLGCASRKPNKGRVWSCSRLAEGDFGVATSSECAVEKRCKSDPRLVAEGDVVKTRRRSAARTVLDAMALPEPPEERKKKRKLIRDDGVRDAYVALLAKEPETRDAELPGFIDQQLAGGPFKALYEAAIRRVIKLGRYEFLRDCQVSLECPHYFSYLLLEADGAELGRLDAVAKQGSPWSGLLHLGPELTQ